MVRLRPDIAESESFEVFIEADFPSVGKNLISPRGINERDFVSYPGGDFLGPGPESRGFQSAGKLHKHISLVFNNPRITQNHQESPEHIADS